VSACAEGNPPAPLLTCAAQLGALYEALAVQGAVRGLRAAAGVRDTAATDAQRVLAHTHKHTGARQVLRPHVG
jgi:hypothetical protein